MFDKFFNRPCKIVPILSLVGKEAGSDTWIVPIQDLDTDAGLLFFDRISSYSHDEKMVGIRYRTDSELYTHKDSIVIIFEGGIDV